MENSPVVEMFVETHGHLVGVRGERDLDAVVRRAEEAGVVLILTAGIDLPSSVKAVEVAKRYETVKACVGIHPWYADEYDEEAERRLRELAGEREVVAISEIGLDFFGRMTHSWSFTSEYIEEEVQYRTLRGQLGLARERGLPVIVHDRAKGFETLEILEEEGVSEIGGAIHGFSRDLDYARRCIDLGVYLSVSDRALSRPENEGLREAVKEIPLEWLLTETDTGNPEGVVKAAERIAELKGLTTEEVGEATTSNLRRLLKIPD
ncbi:TatD family deoxyribonuclease [Candidatus Bathyarchaeota archaeon]|nr:MAG: TatD family deoxyribonuclease [Candidatus Bathyarchaeota archaeon]